MNQAPRLFGLLSLVFLVLAGCAELGQMGFPGDYGNWGGNDVFGEVRYIDSRNRQIELSTDAGRAIMSRRVRNKIATDDTSRI
jgi:hypothetical protein